MNKHLIATARACELVAALCAAAAPALAQGADYGGGYTGGGPLPSYTTPSGYPTLSSPLIPLRTPAYVPYTPPGDPEVQRQIEELRQRNHLLEEQAREQLLQRLIR